MIRNSRCLVSLVSSFSLIDSTSSGWMIPLVPLNSCGKDSITLLQKTASDAKSQYQLPARVTKLGSKKMVTVLSVSSLVVVPVEVFSSCKISPLSCFIIRKDCFQKGEKRLCLKKSNIYQAL